MQLKELSCLLALALVFFPLTGKATVNQSELEEIRKSIGEDAAALSENAADESVSPAGTSEGAALEAAASNSNWQTSTAGRMLQSLNPDISIILDTALAWFGNDAADFQLGAHDPLQNGFNLQQLEFAITSIIDPFFRFDANLVFAQFGVEVEEAFATSLALPANLQVRAGQFLTRFGRMNNTHPHSWSFVDQAMVFGKFFGAEGSRGLGAEVSWLSPLPWYVETVFSVNDANGECCARSFYGGQLFEPTGARDFVFTGALKQFFPITNDWSFNFGLSTQQGPNPTGYQNRTEVYGTDVYLKYRPVDRAGDLSLAVQSEALLRRRQVPGDNLVDGGGYVQLVGRLNRVYEVGLRYELVSGVADDYLNPTWQDFKERNAIQMTYYPSHFSRIRLQFGRTQDYQSQQIGWSTMLQFEVVAGEHGSHDF